MMVNWENYEEYMLLAADGELNEAEEKALHAFVAEHPELKKELDMYLSARLVPDTAITYTQKDSLLKTAPVATKTINLRSWWVYGTAAAAIVLAIITFMPRDNEEVPAIVHTTTPATTEEVKQVPADTIKDLHSTPVNPVTIENHLAKQTPARKEKTIEKRPQPAPIAPKKEENYIAKEEKQKTEPIANPKQESQPEERIVVKEEKQTESYPTMEEANEPLKFEDPKKDKKGLLAWLPLRKEKKEGLNAVAQAVNEKIDQVKELKNTDVSVRLGNHELFVVKL